MDALFQLAFFAGLGLWIPLALIAALQPSVRRRVMVPLLASAIAAAFEAYISFVWSQTNSIPMRVDVFFVLCALTFVDAIAGFSLVVGARGRPDRTPLLAAGMLCLAVPALAIAGFAALRLDFARVAPQFRSRAALPLRGLLSRRRDREARVRRARAG